MRWEMYTQIKKKLCFMNSDYEFTKEFILLRSCGIRETSKWNDKKKWATHVLEISQCDSKTYVWATKTHEYD